MQHALEYKWTVEELKKVVVSGKACAWRVLGMMPSLRKSATLTQSDTWRKDCRLRMHHACIAHVVEMINKFGSEDKYMLCADGQVYSILVYTMYILVYNMYILVWSGIQAIY